MLASVEEGARLLEGAGYLPVARDRHLGLPGRAAGEAAAGGGAGRRRARPSWRCAFAAATGRKLIRLQCYEGLDEAKALYEWEYAKQLLYTQMLKERIGEAVAGAAHARRGGRPASTPRATSSSASASSCRARSSRRSASDVPALLLVDEVDKADPEFEAFLLEVLAD